MQNREMFAIRTRDEFVFVENQRGERIGTYSARSKLHMEFLLEHVGKQVFDILSFNVDKRVNIRTLEIEEL